MVYIGNFEALAHGSYRVGLVHYAPFDPKYGLGKTRDELLKNGAFVEEVPSASAPDGMVVDGLFYNPSTGALWYEYRQQRQERSTEERIAALEYQNQSLMLALAESIEQQQTDKIAMQVAMAEIIETVMGGGV